MSTPPKTLTVTQQHALLNALLCEEGTHKQFRRGLRNYTLAMMMLETGLRVGELVQLRWSDAFFNSRPCTSIVIRAEIAKNHREREIPVSLRLSKALTEYHQYHYNLILHSADMYLFFAQFPHQPLTTRQVERIIETAGIQALGRDIHPHMLRHTFGTKLMRVTDMRTVQELLGHKHLSSTQVYLHPDHQDKTKAITAAELRQSEYENSCGLTPATETLTNTGQARGANHNGA